MWGPGLFSDIGKWARELLEKDYDHGQMFTLSTRSGSFMTTILRRSGVYGDISRFKYDKIINDTEGGLESASLRKISLILKQLSVVKSPNDALFPNFCWRGPNDLSVYNFGQVEMQCFHDFWTVTGAMDLKSSPTFNLSGTAGVRDAVVLGASAGYDTSSNTLTRLDAGISLTYSQIRHPVQTFFQATYTVLLMDKGDILKLSLAADYIRGKYRHGIVVETVKRFSTNRRTDSFGLLYAWGPFTMKMRMSCLLDKFAVFFQLQLDRKTKLKISSEHDIRDTFKNPRVGLALAINL